MARATGVVGRREREEVEGNKEGPMVVERDPPMRTVQDLVGERGEVGSTEEGVIQSANATTVGEEGGGRGNLECRGDVVKMGRVGPFVDGV